LPTSRNPEKQRFPTFLQHRLKIINFFIKKKLWIKIKTEFLPKEGEFEYTAVTFKKIKRKHPNNEFFFIIGDDLLPTLRS
jgi:nicotinate-nucleotide adenylyltransferase